MLEVAIDRLQGLLATTLREFTAGEAEVSLESIGAQRLGDWLGGLKLPAMIPVFRAVEWDGDGLLALDGRLVYSIVEVLLGSRRRAAPMRVESRAFTTIEATLIERLSRLILVDLGRALGPIAQVQCRLERTETDPRLAAIVRPASACVVVRLRVDLGDRGGRLELVLPEATIEPVRPVLAQAFMGEKLGADPIWQHHLAQEVWQAEVDLEAVLEERTGTLAEIMALEVGSVLWLEAHAETLATLRCGQVPILKGQVGRRGDTVVIKIEDPALRRREG